MTLEDRDQRGAARVGGIVFDCANPRTLARFWRDAVGFRVRHLPDEPEDLDQWAEDPDWVTLYDPDERSPTPPEGARGEGRQEPRSR